MVKFSEKFGLPTDRIKLTEGERNFEIVRVEIKKSKKLYDTRVTDEDGNTQVKKKYIDIAYIDAKMSDGTLQKFYAPNNAIVEACKDFLSTIGVDGKGNLKESVFIESVKSAKGESKNEYIFFS